MGDEKEMNLDMQWNTNENISVNVWIFMISGLSFFIFSMMYFISGLNSKDGMVIPRKYGTI